MNIKILTPEYVVFEGEVDSILLPGENGEFHIMKNHASIVSTLVTGILKLYTNDVDENFSRYLKKDENEGVYTYSVKNGVVEFNNEKGIILCE